jgi:FKBP-type peptidyl-prolyl cis-trans isomerase FklB
MKCIILTTSLCLALIAPVLADDAGAVNSAEAVTVTNGETSTNVFNSEEQRASYAFGMYYGHLLKSHGANVESDVFIRGFKDAQSGGPLLMTPQEMQQTLMEFQKSLIAEQQHKRELLAAENKKQGDEFLAENKKKPGVHVLPDGVQYKIITEGKGKRPGTNDVVLVNYRGTFLDGTVFDSTPGSPVEEALTATKIQGLRDTLPKMKTGSVWEIVIPSDLAYGTNGLGSQIPPNATLVYTLQLVSFGPPGSSPMAAITNPPLTSDIIAVPSAAEMKKGKQPYTLTPAEVQKLQQQMQNTNR